MISQYTNHAKVRTQQRGIPPLIVDFIYRYGQAVRSNGADVYCLNKLSRKKLKQDIGSIVYRRIRDLLDTYIVVSDSGYLITAAKRYKRIKE